MNKRKRRKFICAPVLVLVLLLMSVGLAVAQSPVATNSNVKFFATQLSRFGIPFAVDPADQSIIEVQMYFSTDQGRSWIFAGRQTVDKREFPFVATADGEYWFALKTLNRNRRLVPEGIPQPELVILVDTRQPELDFRIETDPSGRVICRWKASDENLKPQSLQIQYQPEDADPESWLEVSVQLNGTARNGAYADQLAWWPETTSRSLNVRLAISDAAGNTAQEIRKVVVPPSPWRHRSRSTALPANSIPNSQPNSMAAAEQNFKKSANTTPVDSSSEMQLHCENGVCRLVPRAQPNPADVAAVATAQPDPQRRGKTQPPTTGPQNRFASHSRLPLVGDPPEYAAPPVPPGMTAAELAQLQTPTGATQSKTPMPAIANSQSQAIAWSSEPERWVPKRQSTVATTRAPDPSLVPNPYAQQTKSATTALPTPNPATQKLVGNQVVSESTTMAPNNQYQGLQPLPSTASTPPILMPNQTMPKNGPTQPAPTQTAPTPSANPPTGSPGFQSAGYGSESRSVMTGQEADQADAVRPSNSLLQQPIQRRNEFGSGSSDAATEMIGSKRFRLNYGIDAIDPSGVARVDLWMTKDGRNWTSWGSDPDATSPFPVEVPEQGRYGFRIVVHSKDGLTGVGPSSGDPADIWVHIDTQSPLARITSVPYGRGDEAGRLVINFSVADPHLVLRPITLAYGESPEGPWKLIAEGVRNEGRYVWKPTIEVPDRIFLRLDARDRAGNLGVHILDQPIDVSGLVPHGTIHGVIPVGN